MTSPKVAYLYDPMVGIYHYGIHPMRPFRIKLAHELIVNYNLLDHMTMMTPHKASIQQLTRFHTDEYINFLAKVSPSTRASMEKEAAKFNLWDDCPTFEGLFEFCQISAGASMDAANALLNNYDIAINWSGGLHHSKAYEASGFCYVNDIVLGILELLRYHERVLYIDIDVHHGDGVEEAFYTTDRVMTLSFHKYGNFFPGTGDLMDIGVEKGKYYSVNVPLKEGVNDDSYKSIFEPVVQHIMQWYRPGAVVLQSGADSLSGDKLGCFNLSHLGHSHCLKFLKKFNVPIMLLGGGGYTIRNVSRAWAYETSVACGVDLEQNLPYNSFFDYFGPDYVLQVPSTNMNDLNSPQYLENIK